MSHLYYIFAPVKNFIREYLPYLLALLPLLFLRDFTPDNELKYVSLARECLEQGHFFALTYQGEPYVGEPPLYILIIAFFKVIFFHNYMVTIGLLSLLPALGVLMVMNRWIERYGAREMRLLDGSQSRSMASFMLFTTGLFLGQSFFASNDMLMCFFITLSLYTFWRLAQKEGSYSPSLDVTDRRRRRRLQWQLGIYLFMGAFSGGALGFVVPFLSMLFYALWQGCLGRVPVREAFRIWDRASNWRTWIAFLVLVALWTLGTWYEGGMEYLRSFAQGQLLYPAFYSVRHVHGWWYYLLCIWYDSLPWGPICILLLLHNVYRRLIHWRQTHEHLEYSELQTFFTVICLTTLLLVSCFKGKLDVFLLPIYPFLIYAGVMEMRHHRWPLRLNWPIVWVCRGMLVIVFVSGLLMPVLNPYIGAYGRICYRANRIARQAHTEGFYTYHLPSTRSMDVYLHEDPRVATLEDIVENRLQNTLLITYTDDLRHLEHQFDQMQVPDSLRGEVITELGPYVVMKFK